MLLPGHIAAPYLLRQGFRFDLGFAMAASLFPDLVDKTLAWFLHVTPYGRYLAHNLTALAVTTLVVWAIFKRKAAVSWLIGYAVHLALDLGSYLPLLWPWIDFQFPTDYRFRFTYMPYTHTAEIIITLIAIRVWVKNRRALTIHRSP